MTLRFMFNYFLYCYFTVLSFEIQVSNRYKLNKKYSKLVEKLEKDPENISLRTSVSKARVSQISKNVHVCLRKMLKLHPMRWAKTKFIGNWTTISCHLHGVLIGDIMLNLTLKQKFSRGMQCHNVVSDLTDALNKMLNSNFR